MSEPASCAASSADRPETRFIAALASIADGVGRKAARRKTIARAPMTTPSTMPVPPKAPVARI